ncbi:unnamed protein product, partial [Owenia fusiformis]
TYTFIFDCLHFLCLYLHFIFEHSLLEANIFRMNGSVVFGCILVVLVAVSAKDCDVGTDCGDVAGLCCVSRQRPRGKRSADETSTGTCQPMGVEGADCLVRNNDEDYKSTAVYVNCPCAEGMTCKGIGVFDMPLGEQGKCRKT